MRKTIIGVIAASILSIGIAAALAQTAPAKTADTSKGKTLVDDKGMTLYIFDRDTSGKSNCNGQCAGRLDRRHARRRRQAMGLQGQAALSLGQGHQARRRDRRRRQQRLACRRAVSATSLSETKYFSAA
jgi:predicted lipoprotein with Yx(FWY)xxD motif